jgi:hypothetical protein
MLYRIVDTELWLKAFVHLVHKYRDTDVEISNFVVGPNKKSINGTLKIEAAYSSET